MIIVLITVVSGLYSMEQNGKKWEKFFPQAFQHTAYKYPSFLKSFEKDDSIDMRISFMGHQILFSMQLFGSFANDVLAKKIEEAVKSDMPGKGMVPDDQAKQLLNFCSNTMPTLEKDVQDIKQMLKELGEYKQKLEAYMANL